MINDDSNTEILIPPKEYIRVFELSDDGRPACSIQVIRDTNRVLGAPLFRKHAVLFDPNSRQIGFCESA